MQIKDLELLNNMPFFSWAKDEDGKYLWINKYLFQFIGEDIVGKKDSELPWCNEANVIREMDKKVLETGKPHFFNEYVDYIDKLFQGNGKAELSTCKFPGELDGKKCTIGIAFIIEK